MEQLGTGRLCRDRRSQIYSKLIHLGIHSTWPLSRALQPCLSSARNLSKCVWPLSARWFSWEGRHGGFEGTGYRSPWRGTEGPCGRPKPVFGCASKWSTYLSRCRGGAGRTLPTPDLDCGKPEIGARNFHLLATEGGRRGGEDNDLNWGAHDKRTVFRSGPEGEKSG